MSPASRARSTEASVWPVRSSTPPGRARSGNMWPGWTRSCGPVAGVDGDADRVRAIGRGDAGGDALAGLDRDRERGAERRWLLGAIICSSSSSQRLGRQRQADQAAAVLGHEVDRVGGDVLGGHAEVALVLPVGRVDDDDHLAGPDVLDRVLDGEKGEGRRSWICLADCGRCVGKPAFEGFQRSAGSRASRSTYFPMSRSRGSRAARREAPEGRGLAGVWDEQTSNPSPSRPPPSG